MEKSLLLHLKIIEKALTDMSKDLHFVRNDNNYERDFLSALNTLLKEYPLPHTMPSDMKPYIWEVLKVCCELYKADWCGIIVADATSEVWGPAEWYSVKDGPMGHTNIRENEFFEDLPKFSCHSLRHTCATRLCEAGINLKVIQDAIGHADITTTMNIYTDTTIDFKTQEMGRFNEFIRVATQSSE